MQTDDKCEFAPDQNSGWQGLSGNEDGSLSLCLTHLHLCHMSPQRVGGYPLIAANEQKPSYISKEQKSLKSKGIAITVSR